MLSQHADTFNEIKVKLLTLLDPETIIATQVKDHAVLAEKLIRFINPQENTINHVGNHAAESLLNEISHVRRGLTVVIVRVHLEENRRISSIVHSVTKLFVHLQDRHRT